MYNHPATQFVCRHCGVNAGYDPEMCFYCGPICNECFVEERPEYPCPAERAKHKKETAPLERARDGQA